LKDRSTLVDPEYSNFEASVYQGFSRLSWGLAIGWIIFACARGYGGRIDLQHLW